MKCPPLAVAIIVCVMVQQVLAQGHLDGAYLRDVTGRFVTPHLQWGKPLKGGPVKSMFVVPRRIAAREVVELAQRLELDYRAVATASALALGADNVYDAAVQGTSTREKTQELLEKLDDSYEVIVLANFDLHALSAEAQYKILRHVANGAGLLIVYPRPIRYKDLFQHSTEDWRSVLAQVSSVGLPQSLQNVEGEKLLQTYGFGKGRIAVLSYPGPPPSAGSGGLGLTLREEYSPQWRTHYENNLVLVGRSLLWAAGREAPFAMRLQAGDNLTPRELSDKGLAVSFENEAPLPEAVRLRVRDEWNAVRWEEEVAIQDRQTDVDLKLPQLPAGAYCLDAIAEAEGKVINFGYQGFAVASAVGGLTLTTDKTTYERGEVVRCTLTLGQPASSELTVRARLEDSPYRQVWAKCEAVIGAGERQVTFELPSGALPTIASAVVCDVSEASTPIGQTQEYVFLPQREIELFPTILWDAVPIDLSEMYAQAVVEGLGWRAGLTHPTARGGNARVAALFDQRFIPYTTRIGLKSDKDGATVSAHWLGLDKKEIEAADIQQDGSFYNPKVQALWKKSLEKRLDGLPAYGPMIYSLGDENHFSYDAGYSPSDEKAFRQYLEQRYGQIGRLNQEWQTSYPDFESVEHPSPESLRKQGMFAQWYDHRRYMERQYADVHHFLADCIRAIDPHAKVGAEGSVPGDLESTMSKLDFWAPYSDLVMDEVQRSIDASKLHPSWWGGFVGGIGGRDNYPWPLWRQLLQGVVNGSAWYSGAIDCFGLLGVDFSYAEYFERMRPRLESLENGQAQLLISQPLKRDGIAILWSHASASASVMDERFFRPTDSMNTFIQFCYRQGLNFDFLTSSMLESGKLDGYRVLLLCGASALSERETQQIVSFAQQGGLVIADLKPGVLNDYCRPLQSSSLESLFGLSGMDWQSQLVLEPVNVQLETRGRPLRFEAERAWRVAEIPSVAQAVGEGIAILLNFNLGSAANTASSSESFDAFLLDVLSLAHVAPSIHASGPAADQLLLRVRQDRDCTTVGTLMTKEALGKTLTLALTHPAYVYEVGKGPRGRHQNISTTVNEPFQLLCLFPQEPLAPVLRVDRARLSVGEAARIDLAELSAGGVYQLKLIDPQGKIMSRRGRILTDLDRVKPVELRFAYSDEPGAYQAVLTDVRTTLTSSVTIQVNAEVPQN